MRRSCRVVPDYRFSSLSSVYVICFYVHFQKGGGEVLKTARFVHLRKCRKLSITPNKNSVNEIMKFPLADDIYTYQYLPTYLFT